MGYKFLQLELDSKVVLFLLTNYNVNYPTNMLPLICDCRNLLHHKWEVHVQHVYREANGCADVLAKRGTHQQPLVCVCSTCPSFANVSYIKDLIGLGETRLCTLGAANIVI